MTLTPTATQRVPGPLRWERGSWWRASGHQENLHLSAIATGEGYSAPKRGTFSRYHAPPSGAQDRGAMPQRAKQPPVVHLHAVSGLDSDVPVETGKIGEHGNGRSGKRLCREFDDGL